MNLIKQPMASLPTPAISGEAEEARNELALAASAITSISSADDNAVARNVAVELRQYLKAVEETRTELTKPLLHGQWLLKALADDHVKPLQNELKRLERLATVFLEAQQSRVAAEMKARLELAAEAKSDADFAIISNEAMPEMAKARGQTIKRVLRWEVTDLMALVQARPDLCKIEAKPSAINACCVPEMPNKPPGLKLWWENKATFTTR